MGYTSKYHLITDEETGQKASLLFIVQYIDDNNKKLRIAPKSPRYTALIHSYAYNKMRLKVVGVDRKPSIKGFNYGITAEPVDWKRDIEHPACADLAALMKDYDRVIKPHVESFTQEEVEIRYAIHDLSIKIYGTNYRKERIHHEFRELAYEKSTIIKLLMAPDRLDISDFLFRSLPEWFVKQTSILLALEAGADFVHKYTSSLEEELKQLDKERYSKILELESQREGVEACNVFLEDYQWLHSGLVCQGS